MYRKPLTLLAALTISLNMAACSKSNSSDAATGATQQASSIQTTAPAQTTVPTETTPQFQAIPLVDDNSCTVTITSLDEENLFGYTLNVFLENKTDKELMFTVNEVSVNGYMCDPFWAATVSAGKKANEQITFMESDFETNGIEEVTDITFTLQVYDSNDWTADYLVEQTFTLNP